MDFRVVGFLLQFLVIGYASAECTRPEICDHCIAESFPQDGPTFPAGSYLIWRCDDGYVMEGTSDRVVWMCNNSGDQWLNSAQPVCKERRCQHPPVPAYGATDPTSVDSLTPGATVTYGCQEGYSRRGTATNTCQQNGTWEMLAPTCINTNCSSMDIGITDHSCVITSQLSNANTYTWKDAVDMCSSTYGGSLAMVKTHEMQTLLEGTMNLMELFNPDNNYWIGAAEGDNWKWTHDSSDISRLFWGPNNPSQSSGTNCIILRAPLGFAWGNLSCGERRGSICEYDSSCDLIYQDGTSTMFDFNGPKCFKFVRSMKTWARADSGCIKDGGRLAEPKDSGTQEFLTESAASMDGDQDWWIGGFDDVYTGARAFYWADNTVVNFTSWDATQPDTPGDKCIEMNGDTGHLWNDADCTAPRRAMCQRGIPACGDPGDPINGSRMPSDRSTFLESDVVEFSCDLGHVIDGPEVITCLPSGTWDFAKPMCEAIICDEDVGVVTMATATILSNSYRGVALYTCSPGTAPSGDPVSVCLVNGTWSVPPFSCNVPFPPPTTRPRTPSDLNLTTGPTANSSDCITNHPPTDEHTTSTIAAAAFQEQLSFRDVMIPVFSALFLSIVIVLVITLFCVIMKRKTNQQKEAQATRMDLPTYGYMDHYANSVMFKNPPPSDQAGGVEPTVRFVTTGSGPDEDQRWSYSGSNYGSNAGSDQRPVSFTYMAVSPSIVVSDFHTAEGKNDNRGRANTVQSNASDNPFQFDDGYASLSTVNEVDQRAQSPNSALSIPSSPSALYADVSRISKRKKRKNADAGGQTPDGYTQLNVGEVQRSDQFPYTKLTPSTSPAGSSINLRDDSWLSPHGSQSNLCDDHVYSETDPGSDAEESDNDYERLAMPPQTINSSATKIAEGEGSQFYGINDAPTLPKRNSVSASLESLRQYQPSGQVNGAFEAEEDGIQLYEKRITTYDQVDDPALIFNELYVASNNKSAPSFLENHAGSSFESYHEYDEMTDACGETSDEKPWTFSDLYSQTPKPVILLEKGGETGTNKDGVEKKVEASQPNPPKPYYHCLNPKRDTDAINAKEKEAGLDTISQCTTPDVDPHNQPTTPGPYYYVLEQPTQDVPENDYTSLEGIAKRGLKGLERIDEERTLALEPKSGELSDKPDPGTTAPSQEEHSGHSLHDTRSGKHELTTGPHYFSMDPSASDA